MYRIPQHFLALGILASKDDASSSALVLFLHVPYPNVLVYTAIGSYHLGLVVTKSNGINLYFCGELLETLNNSSKGDILILYQILWFLLKNAVVFEGSIFCFDFNFYYLNRVT